MILNFIIIIAIIMSIVTAGTGVVMLATSGEKMIGKPLIYMGGVGCVAFGVLYKCVSDISRDEEQDLENQYLDSD